MSIEKVIENGSIAVAYSPGYGAGWSSWNTNMFPDKEVEETLLYHPEIIKMILSGRQKEITTSWLVEHFGEKFKNVYDGGNEQLEVCWISEGTKFKIDVHDGNETIVCGDNVDWYKA